MGHRRFRYLCGHIYQFVRHPHADHDCDANRHCDRIANGQRYSYCDDHGLANIQRDRYCDGHRDLNPNPHRVAVTDTGRRFPDRAARSPPTINPSCRRSLNEDLPDWESQPHFRDVA